MNDLTTGGKDYVLQIKVKNGPMLRAMRNAGFQTALALARAANCGPSTVGEFLNLTDVPLRSNGNWAPAILRIAEVLKVLPEDLFPPQHLRAALKKNRAEIDMSSDDVCAVLDWGLAYSTTPEIEQIENDKSRALSACLNSLIPRQHRVLALRFGLDGKEPRTLEQVGIELGITGNRVRQIEAKALRNLKHPARARQLASAGWDMAEQRPSAN